ncbi:MAG: S8 family peptidase [Bacteroidales bacterium]|nr:S8 family peptidase [Bacteroidales bacterium]
MKKIFTLIAIILLIPFLISQKPPRNGDKPYVEGQIMIKLRSDLPQRQQQMLQEVLADFKSVNLDMVEKLSGRLNIFLLRYNPGVTDDDRLLKEIKVHPDVELAQFNHYIQQRELIPSDEFFGLQWNMHNTGQTGGTNDADIDGPEAWDLGNSGVTATGDTIIVAIVDDGFDIDHEDISYWKNYHDIPGNGIDDDTNGYIDDYNGWNSWTNSGEIIERDHGTHVTGIAAAQGNNSKGVTGVNLHVKVMPVVGSASVESIVVAGYAYILEMRTLYNETGGEKGAFIVSTNASFGVDNGQPEDFPIWGAMYDSLGMQGILSAGATANANVNIDVVGDIPTAFPSDFLITVTNTDNDDVKSSFAAYGPTTIDLGAPGTQIYSTRQSNAYGYKTGTSMASPHVAGAIAYMFSVASEEFMTAYHNDPAGMALLIKQYILDGVDPLPSLDGITVTGGRLNIYKAALYVSEVAVNISADQETICLGESVQLTSYVIGSPGPFTYTWTSDPAGFTSSEANVTVIPDVTTTYFLEVFDGSVTVEDQITIQVNPLPSVDIGADTSICQGESLVISAGEGFASYLWNTGETTISIETAVQGEYWVEVTNEFGCTATDALILVVVQMPEKPVISSGPASVDNYIATSSTFSCAEVPNAISYQWFVAPAEAGTTSSTGTDGEFAWTIGYTGSVLITVVGINDCWNSEFSDAFATEIYSSAGVNENAGNRQLILYPNPAKEGLSFKVSGLSSGKDYSFGIFDATGKQIQEIKVPSGQHELRLNVELYQPGVYIAILKGDEQIIESSRFVIAK